MLPRVSRTAATLVTSTMRSSSTASSFVSCRVMLAPNPVLHAVEVHGEVVLLELIRRFLPINAVQRPAFVALNHARVLGEFTRIILEVIVSDQRLAVRPVRRAFRFLG